MNALNKPYTVLPFPRDRLLMIDGGQIGLQKHTVHGLVEFDVTQTRDLILQHKSQTGETLSFSAFILACIGKALDAHRHVHAYRSWRNKLFIFDDVDVNTLFEVALDGKQTVRPHILRSINKKTVFEIHQEIRDFQQNYTDSTESKFVAWLVRMPRIVRRLFLRFLFANPTITQKYFGTVLVTSIGQFGEGGGWGIPVPNHNLQLTLGGIVKKPVVFEDQIAIRDYLSVTISFNHDIVDGAPAARFIQNLKCLVERGYGLSTNEKLST